jgi:hypothetical protein
MLQSCCDGLSEFVDGCFLYADLVGEVWPIDGLWAKEVAREHLEECPVFAGKGVA